MTDPFRKPGPDEAEPKYPRWPALAGIRVIARAACSRAGLKMIVHWTLVVLAFALAPFSAVVHGLRHLGGADPARDDIPKMVADGYSMDSGPAAFLGAFFGSVATVTAICVACFGVT